MCNGRRRFFDRLLLRVSDLELGPLGRGGLRSGRDFGIVEDGSGMERSSEWRMTSGEVDVAEANFKKVGCGRGSRLDSWSCGLLGEGV